MSRGITIRMTGQWRELRDCIDPRKFTQRVQAKVDAMMKKHAKAVAAKAKEMQGLAANGPMTQFIKGRNEPGVRTGRLKSSIRVISFGKMSYWVGVPKSSPAYKEAVLLSDGAVLPVTEEMRSMFLMLWACSEGKAQPDALHGRAAELWKQRPGGWLPLKEETTHLIIVPRKFMEEAWQDVQLSYDLAGQLTKAVQAALTAPARKGRNR